MTGTDVRRREFEIVVQSEPVPKARPRLGRGRVFTPRATELAESRIRAAWVDAGNPVLLEALTLTLTALLPRPQGHYGTGRNAGKLRLSAPRLPAGRPDLDNYVKTVMDALNGAAWRDDGQVVTIVAHKEYADEITGPPCWRICVAPIEDVAA